MQQAFHIQLLTKHSSKGKERTRMDRILVMMFAENISMRELASRMGVGEKKRISECYIRTGTVSISPV